MEVACIVPGSAWATQVGVMPPQNELVAATFRSEGACVHTPMRHFAVENPGAKKAVGVSETRFVSDNQRHGLAAHTHGDGAADGAVIRVYASPSRECHIPFSLRFTCE